MKTEQTAAEWWEPPGTLCWWYMARRLFGKVAGDSKQYRQPVTLPHTAQDGTPCPAEIWMNQNKGIIINSYQDCISKNIKAVIFLNIILK